MQYHTDVNVPVGEMGYVEGIRNNPKSHNWHRTCWVQCAGYSCRPDLGASSSCSFVLLHFIVKAVTLTLAIRTTTSALSKGECKSFGQKLIPCTSSTSFCCRKIAAATHSTKNVGIGNMFWHFRFDRDLGNSLGAWWLHRTPGCTWCGGLVIERSWIHFNYEHVGLVSPFDGRCVVILGLANCKDACSRTGSNDKRHRSFVLATFEYNLGNRIEANCWMKT